MGNTVSGIKDRSYEEMVDFGSLTPQGIYTGPQDWHQQIVGNLIIDRKLAPFYRPLEDYDDSWDDEQILAARKELPNSPQSGHSESSQGGTSPLSSKSHHGKNSNKNGKDPLRLSEASVYRGAVECPICFLYYPPNINHSRCCDQAICTECFVQIKRAEPTTTHLVSEPAACPYCVQENFGVTYQPPEWRVGLVRDGYVSPPSPSRSESKTRPSEAGQTKRRKSFGADDPEVVTIDQIRPDWEAKLASVRAAVQRRANRRIIMRQVGDRLIPVGITSGRIVNMEQPEGGGESEGSSRRRRRLHPSAELNQLMGPDIEELMLMEAMRLSAIEYEEQQRRNAANNSANANNTNTDTNTNTNTNVNDNGIEPPVEGSNTSSSAPSNTSTANVITPSSSPNASPRNSLSPPNESGRSPSSSPRQSFNRMPSPLGANPEPGLRRSTSSSSGSGIIAALAAHTASAILGSESLDTSRMDPAGPTEVAPTNVSQSGVDFPPEGTSSTALASPEVRIEPPPLSPVRTENVPSPPSSSPPTEGLSITLGPGLDDSPAVPPLPERTISADDAAAERMPEGYVPLPSTTDLSDPLL